MPPLALHSARRSEADSQQLEVLRCSQISMSRSYCALHPGISDHGSSVVVRKLYSADPGFPNEDRNAESVVIPVITPAGTHTGAVSAHPAPAAGKANAPAWNPLPPGPHAPNSHV